MTVMCKNMTHALKGNKILYQNGIYSKVEKETSVDGISGCVYTLTISERDFNTALSIMFNSGVILHKKEYDYYGDLAR
jgi:hypothetical protein